MLQMTVLTSVEEEMVATWLVDDEQYRGVSHLISRVDTTYQQISMLLIHTSVSALDMCHFRHVPTMEQKLTATAKEYQDLTAQKCQVSHSDTLYHTPSLFLSTLYQTRSLLWKEKSLSKT